MGARIPRRPPLLRFRMALVNAFVAFHLVAIAAWLAPPGWLLRDRVAALVGPYLNAVGLAQSWGMFSPDPPRFNPTITASLRYADGRTRTWAVPPLDGAGELERTQKWRYRRWSWHLVAQDDPRLWADAARWVVRRHGSDPANPAVAVALKVRTVPIPPPGGGAAAGKGAREVVVASFDVRPEARP